MARDEETRKRIAVVCDIYGKENNGSDVVAGNLIRFLQRRGHDVRIVCADPTKIGTDGYFVVPNLHFGKALDAYVAKTGVALAKPEKAVIRQALSGADVVHIMMPLPLGLAAIRVAKELDLPVTAGFHMQAENLTAYFRLDRLKAASVVTYRLLYDNFYRYCDAIHYPTAFIRDAFERSIRRRTAGYVITNGVHPYVRPRPTEKPEAYRDKIVILTTGRYAAEKSQDTLLKAVPYSRHKDKILLILAGEGVREAYYRKLAEDLPVPPVFRFFGRAEIIDVLNYADLYVHPAVIELEGISCIEAIACGKLTIVSDSKRSATRGFAANEKCVFKAGDERDLARVLDYWIENEDERKACEKKYLESAVAFDQAECMRKTEKMILDAAEAHKVRAASYGAYRSVKKAFP